MVMIAAVMMYIYIWRRLNSWCVMDMIG